MHYRPRPKILKACRDNAHIGGLGLVEPKSKNGTGVTGLSPQVIASSPRFWTLPPHKDSCATRSPHGWPRSSSLTWASVVKDPPLAEIREWIDSVVVPVMVAVDFRTNLRHRDSGARDNGSEHGELVTRVTANPVLLKGNSLEKRSRERPRTSSDEISRELMKQLREHGAFESQALGSYVQVIDAIGISTIQDCCPRITRDPALLRRDLEYGSLDKDIPPDFNEPKSGRPAAKPTVLHWYNN